MNQLRKFYYLDRNKLFNIAFISIWLIAFGTSLLFVEEGRYLRQAALMPLDVWGTLFIITGVLTPLRLFIRKNLLYSNLLHLALLTVLALWVATWIVTIPFAPATLAYSSILYLSVQIGYIREYPNGRR